MEKQKHLTCTRCGEVKQTYSEIVYSQGDKVVCLTISLIRDSKKVKK